ncbi:MAG: hypothetical protein Kow0098_22630 [Ignavibacteriaceae bacterium]
MKLKIILWSAAFLLTILSAFYQRITGPTYPYNGQVYINDSLINYSLPRSHSTNSDCRIKIIVKDDDISGLIEWKRYKTVDRWTVLPMKRNGNTLSASIPVQPPAGKLTYHLKLKSRNKEFTIPAEGSVVIRFKGEVPDWILSLHIISIFMAMLFSTRTGLEYFRQDPVYKNLTIATLVFLLLGGFIFGPIVQKYAFDAYWTGIPFGTDLTDNKTLIALTGWLVAYYKINKSEKPGNWILFAAILMFIVFLIPHSLFGSELDYSQLNNN